VKRERAFTHYASRLSFLIAKWDRKFFPVSVFNRVYSGSKHPRPGGGFKCSLSQIQTL